MKICKIDGCDKSVRALGLCHSHYRRLRVYGDVNEVRQVQRHNVTPLERLWANVHIAEGCWEWSGCRDVNGYGRMTVNSYPTLVHRVSFEAAHGVTLTPAQHVLHKCDNPSCVRPSHLFLGDHDANMADKMKKGRHVYGVSKGTDHGCAKLTEGDVRTIRTSPETGVAMAKQFGISCTNVSDIRRRRIWKHID